MVDWLNGKNGLPSGTELAWTREGGFVSAELNEGNRVASVLPCYACLNPESRIPNPES